MQWTTSRRVTAWLVLFILATLLMIRVRGQIEQVHVVLVYLLLVLAASAGGERWLGFIAAFAGLLAINYFFQPPFDTMAVSKSLDGVVLAAFLVTALVATQLLSRARAEADRARLHASEVERLSNEVRDAELLREANRMKDIVLASVSHDIRTPLTSIRALAQNVATGAGDARSQAETIVEEVDRLSQMVAKVLDLSRLRAGTFPINPEPNTAEDLLGATIRQFAGVTGAERIRTEIDYSRPALTGEFDFVQSLRILTNLIDNALRYSPADAPVTIEVTVHDSRLVFRVRDQGGGVPASERERIFEPFYRPQGTGHDLGHAGLGLAIARRLAEAQDGAVTYETADGGGSVFILALPLGKNNNT
jgi:K+-sensing histidine kinase KdpD